MLSWRLLYSVACVAALFSTFMAFALFPSETAKENVSLRCQPLPPDTSLLAVNWYLDGGLLKQLPECSQR